jgi:hypothetical protein
MLAASLPSALITAPKAFSLFRNTLHERQPEAIEAAHLGCESIQPPSA